MLAALPACTQAVSIAWSVDELSPTSLYHLVEFIDWNAIGFELRHLPRLTSLRLALELTEPADGLTSPMWTARTRGVVEGEIGVLSNDGEYPFDCG